MTREQHFLQIAALHELRYARMAVIRAQGYLAALAREIDGGPFPDASDRKDQDDYELRRMQSSDHANTAKGIDESIHRLRRTIGQTPLGGRIV